MVAFLAFCFHLLPVLVIAGVVARLIQVMTTIDDDHRKSSPASVAAVGLIALPQILGLFSLSWQFSGVGLLAAGIGLLFCFVMGIFNVPQSVVEHVKARGHSFLTMGYGGESIGVIWFFVGVAIFSVALRATTESVIEPIAIRTAMTMLLLIFGVVGILFAKQVQRLTELPTITDPAPDQVDADETTPVVT